MRGDRPLTTKSTVELDNEEAQYATNTSPGDQQDTQLTRFMVQSAQRLNSGLEPSVISRVDGTIKSIVGANQDGNYPNGYIEIELENNINWTKRDLAKIQLNQGSQPVKCRRQDKARQRMADDI